MNERQPAARLRVVECEPAHADAIAALIVGIQRDEFGFPITLADQPDLVDIAGFYRTGAGNFWVALDADRVVGTIALKDIGDGRGALRKMFVADSHRGAAFGVARSLLDTLVAWCAAHGVGEVFLGTTERFAAAHRFYEKSGFVRIDADALPAAFPRMTLDTRFYRRAIATDKD
jgi:N-acetylglutamate synthase-like GNAT family acetyltransferase